LSNVLIASCGDIGHLVPVGYSTLAVAGSSNQGIEIGRSLPRYASLSRAPARKAAPGAPGAPFHRHVLLLDKTILSQAVQLASIGLASSSLRLRRAYDSGPCKSSRRFIGHGSPSLPIHRPATGVDLFRPIDVEQPPSDAIPPDLVDVTVVQTIETTKSQLTVLTPYPQHVLHRSTGPRGSTRP
jgi:hypothetical protein